MWTSSSSSSYYYVRPRGRRRPRRCRRRCRPVLRLATGGIQRGVTHNSNATNDRLTTNSNETTTTITTNATTTTTTTTTTNHNNTNSDDDDDDDDDSNNNPRRCRVAFRLAPGGSRVFFSPLRQQKERDQWIQLACGNGAGRCPAQPEQAARHELLPWAIHGGGCWRGGGARSLCFSPCQRTPKP